LPDNSASPGKQLFSLAVLKSIARYAHPLGNKKVSSLYVVAFCLYQMGLEDCLRIIEEYWKKIGQLMCTHLAEVTRGLQ